jgi:hypothetical protein
MGQATTTITGHTAPQQEPLLLPLLLPLHGVLAPFLHHLLPLRRL